MDELKLSFIILIIILLVGAGLGVVIYQTVNNFQG